ncbi:hypothetical protein BS78_06G019400 [Paspalum vaginatum]|nr:hypothetical protein BS78_06G019400 [Paspalum vaginatum]
MLHVGRDGRMGGRRGASGRRPEKGAAVARARGPARGVSRGSGRGAGGRSSAPRGLGLGRVAREGAWATRVVAGDAWSDEGETRAAVTWKPWVTLLLTARSAGRRPIRPSGVLMRSEDAARGICSFIIFIALTSTNNTIFQYKVCLSYKGL